VSAPRVLVSGVVLGQPMGGVRRHNQELLPRLARLLEADGGGLAILEGREPPALELPESVERIASDVPSSPPLARARGETRALAEASRAARPFDLVHTAHLPAPRGLAVPYTLTLHDLRRLDPAHGSWIRRRLAARVIGAAVRRAACMIAVSETVRAQIETRFRTPRTALVPNAADHLEVLPRERGDDAPLVHVGHLEPRKNLELLLHALALDPELPDLLLAGSAKSGEDARLIGLAERLGVRERLRLLGAVDDARLARLYARAACVVMPSRIEGFGIPVLEAQRAGAPVAVAAAGALPEVAGDEAPRFSPDDPAACAAAIRAAIEQADATIERARKRAKGSRWDDSARALLAVWREAAR